MAFGRLTQRYNINWLQLTRIAGWLLLIESFFMLAPTLVSMAYNEADEMPFAISTAITLGTGLILAFLGRNAPRHMGKREGYLLTAMVWVVFSIFGMLPFLLCSNEVSITDAFFEAISGFTTTGASVLPVAESFGHGIHIWRALMQWIGGMGIILFTLAVLPMLNHSGGMQMFNAEVTGVTHDKILPRISQTAKALWGVYIGLTITLILLLWAGPMDFFDSVCHAFGAISTGGYSSHAEGIGGWSNSLYIKIVLTAFMFVGGVNFALIIRCCRGDFSALRRNDAFRTYIVAIATMLALIIIAIVWQGKADGVIATVVDPLFMIVSTITSTGYTVSYYTDWGPFVLALTIVMMFSGACAGSTSGGAKIDRLIYLTKNMRNELSRCLTPKSILSVKINGRVAPPDLVNKVIAFLSLYVLLIIAGGIVLTVCGVPSVDALFSSFSCLSNTGLAPTITGYGADYYALPAAAKWYLSFQMLTGRLEIFTVLVLLTRAFWRH